MWATNISISGAHMATRVLVGPDSTNVDVIMINQCWCVCWVGHLDLSWRLIDSLQSSLETHRIEGFMVLSDCSPETHMAPQYATHPPGTRRCCEVESTSSTLIQRRNNVVCLVCSRLHNGFTLQYVCN